MINWILNKISGDYNKKQIEKIIPLVKEINNLYEKRNNLNDEEIKKKTDEFKDRIKRGESLDNILIEAFATVKQACKRLYGKKINVKGQELIWNMIPFDVQLIGGIVLHQGRIAEMKTGEGKTLVATLPAYLNALEGKGVHIVTVNEYLASRDAEWMGYLYNRLGISVGYVTKYTPINKRKEEYSKDITYVENSELGFDYLRDNLVKNLNDRVLLRRDLNYAIIDEVDSILIDEARTPLIISAPSEEPTDKYIKYSQIAKMLKPCKGKAPKAKTLLHRLLDEEKEEIKEECDYYIDEKTKTILLTSNGIKKLEEILGVKNLYKDLGYDEIHHIENALVALACYHKDRDYIIKDGQVLIIDENTGRIMPGRRYSNGLHQAIEAKEGVNIQRESKTLATITYQNFFRQYKKLAGMTGTAATEGEEFEKIYGLEVIVIPTNKETIRVDKPDRIFFNQKAKWNKLIEEIKFYHKIGVPLLIGTSSIETSEILSNLLKKENINHYVLNAKYHEQEALIVANAGKLGSVVVATNMAGRGTDIKLEEGLLDKLAENYINWIKENTNRKLILNLYSKLEYELLSEKLDKNNINYKTQYRKKKTKDDIFANIIIGDGEELIKDIHFGLYVIGTEKHESRRIDNQLRGRSGRQGDPGASIFFVAFDDQLMKKVGGLQMQSLLVNLKFLSGNKNLEEMEITDKLSTKMIENIQKQMEAWHYSIRKHLFEYDSVIDKQRKKIYQERDKILTQEINIFEKIRIFGNDIIEDIIKNYEITLSKEDLNFLNYLNIEQEKIEKFKNIKDLKEYLIIKNQEFINNKINEIEKNENKDQIIKMLISFYLHTIDVNWIEHIDYMNYLREKVILYSYSQQDPIALYKQEGYEKFNSLMKIIKYQFYDIFIKIKFENNNENNIEVIEIKPPKKPFDPCPCGSGKPYILCHGKK